MQFKMLNRQGAKTPRKEALRSSLPWHLGALAVQPLFCALLCYGLLIPFVRAGMQDLTSEHYQIHTDLDWRLAQDLSLRMESMYAQYTVRLADFGPKDTKRFEVYLFARKRDYLDLTQNLAPNTGGVFMPKRSMLAAFLEEQGREGLRRTLQHEAFHQFAYTAISRQLPVWLNEGIAQVFEEGIWTGRQFMLGQVPPRRIRQLHQDMNDGRLVPFRKFLATTPEAWSDEMRDKRTGTARYNQSWAMTHFLIFATDEQGNPRFRARLIAMLKSLHEGFAPTEAFTQAFSDNYEGFQQRFLEYVRTLQPSQESTFVEYQSVLADMLILLDKQGVHFDDAEKFRKTMMDSGYRLRYTKGNVEWSTPTDPSTYFRNAEGQLMTDQQFFFSPRPGAPLPDIVCEPIANLRFRTIFHAAGDKPDHETIIESR